MIIVKDALRVQREIGVAIWFGRSTDMIALRRARDRYRDNARHRGSMSRVRPQFLSTLPLLSKLTADSVQRLWRSADVWTAPSKALLLREGETPDMLFVLLEGLVQVEARSSGRDATILVLRPFDCFFVASVLGNEALPVSARALNEVRVLTIDAEEVRRTAATDPIFSNALIGELTRTFGKIMSELKNARTRTAFERLVAWTLAMHDQSRAGAATEMPYDKSVLAARLGMAPETLSRNLARIAKLGVTIRGRHLTIKNAENLRKLVATSGADMLSLP